MLLLFICKGVGIQSYPLPMAFNAHPKADGNSQRYLNILLGLFFFYYSILTMFLWMSHFQKFSKVYSIKIKFKGVIICLIVVI